MNYLATGEQLTGIADAIRAKTGGSEGLEFPTDFVSGIGTLVDLTTATSDADATASNIKTGKTAYVNGEKITGTYNPKASLTKTLSPIRYQFQPSTTTITVSSQSPITLLPDVQSSKKYAPAPIIEFRVYDQVIDINAWTFDYDLTSTTQKLYAYPKSGTITLSGSSSKKSATYNYVSCYAYVADLT